jgi:hypothetical protein
MVPGQVQPGSALNHISIRMRLSGRLDLPAFKASIQELLRHDILRMGFASVGELPLKRFRPRWPRVTWASLRDISPSNLDEESGGEFGRYLFGDRISPCSGTFLGQVTGAPLHPDRSSLSRMMVLAVALSGTHGTVHVEVKGLGMVPARSNRSISNSHWQGRLEVAMRRSVGVAASFGPHTVPA